MACAASHNTRLLRFGPSYAERLKLADGSTAGIRLLQPDDKEHLLLGLTRMSPESRYSRFMGVRTGFNEAELRYLCEIDGYDHFAIGASIMTPGGNEVGAAVARFVRLLDDPEAAEPAIAVIDDYQGLGLGRLLLDRLASAALERGIHRFHCEFLPSNRRIRRMLARLGRSAVTREDSLAVTMEIELRGADPISDYLGL